jgi:hypothetical protein
MTRPIPTAAAQKRKVKVAPRKCLLGLVMLWAGLLLSINIAWQEKHAVSHPFVPTLNNKRQMVAAASSPQKASVIGFAVTVTECGHSNDTAVPFHIAEGAAVLQYSIHRASSHGNGQYDYQLYAIHHPDAADCVQVLREFGYELIERDTPVPVSDIKGDFLRERIVNNGCCGEKELIKLEVFTLIQHEVVVLLDLDVLLLQPLDRLFDFMLHHKIPPKDDLMLREGETIPDKIDFLYTKDYAMVAPGRRVKPVQGGFVVLCPNMTIYNELVSIVQGGDFRDNGGWGGITGKFYGAMTFQGLMPYYFQVLHPRRAVELNWCVYDNMASPSTDKGVEGGQPVGKCFTNQSKCEDCRNRPLPDVVLAHFTVCLKPWTCQRHAKDNIHHRLCRKFHHAWFQVRSEMELSWGREGRGPGKFDEDLFLGYCTSFGKKGYQWIERPYRTLPAASDSNRQHGSADRNGRFPLHGTAQHSEHCAWITTRLNKNDDKNCTLLVRPSAKETQGISQWMIDVATFHLYSLQAGCRLLFDYGPDVEISKIVAPNMQNWTVPHGFDCKPPSCQMLQSHSELEQSLGISLAKVPLFRYAYSPERFGGIKLYSEDFIDLQIALPGLQAESAVACSLSSLFHLNTEQMDTFVPNLSTIILPPLHHPDVVVFALYIRTGFAEISGLGNVKIRNPEDPSYRDRAANIIRCALQLEKQYNNTSNHFVWMVVSDSPKLKEWMYDEYNMQTTEKKRDIVITQSKGTHSRPSRTPSTKDIAEAMIDWYLIGESDLVITNKESPTFGGTGALRTARVLYDAGDCARLPLVHSGRRETDDRKGDHKRRKWARRQYLL